MKRRDVVRHLEEHGCRLFREGSNHTVFVNIATRKATTIPRHREVKEMLVRKICSDLGIPKP
jgi:mRNA interferase HicA